MKFDLPVAVVHTPTSLLVCLRAEPFDQFGKLNLHTLTLHRLQVVEQNSVLLPPSCSGKPKKMGCR